MVSTETVKHECKTMTLRYPSALMARARRVKATYEINEDRAISMTEIIIKALEKFVEAEGQ